MTKCINCCYYNKGYEDGIDGSCVLTHKPTNENNTCNKSEIKDNPEVTLCKDCEFYGSLFGECSLHAWVGRNGEKEFPLMCEEDYCSWAKRKEK